MFGSKSLNVPFIFRCDPWPQVCWTVSPKHCSNMLSMMGAIGQVSRMQVFDTLLLILYAQPTSGWMKPSSDSPSQTFGQMVNLNYDNHPFHQRDPSIQEPVYWPPHSHYTSLFPFCPFSLRSLWCTIAVQFIKMLLFVSSPSPLGPKAFAPRWSHPKSQSK